MCLVIIYLYPQPLKAYAPANWPLMTDLVLLDLSNSCRNFVLLFFRKLIIRPNNSNLNLYDIRGGSRELIRVN